MILVSAGHHAYKKGASYEGFYEYDEAQIWASTICYYIGFDCKLVPSGVLKDKVEFINSQKNVSIVVEVHFNSAKVWEDLNKNGVVDKGEIKNIGNGCLTLHYPKSIKGIEAAKTVQDSMERVFKRHWNGVMEGYFRMNPANGVDYFLARTLCTSIIIEPEFIHHKELIQSKREEACKLIAESLVNLVKGWEVE